MASPSLTNQGLPCVSSRFDLLPQDSEVISYAVHGSKNLARDPVDLVLNLENPMNLLQSEQITGQYTIEAGINLVPPES